MPLEGDVDLTIRHAQAGDAAVLAQLMCEIGYQTTKSEMQMRVERIATDERYRTFVAVRDRKVSGTIGMFAYYSFVHNDPCGRGGWAAAGHGGGKGLCPTRHQAHRAEYTAYARRRAQVLPVAWLRTKRMAICEKPSGEQLIGTRCGAIGAFLRSQLMR
jgi:hypothetical protein